MAYTHFSYIFDKYRCATGILFYKNIPDFGGTGSKTFGADEKCIGSLFDIRSPGVFIIFL